ncbi:MAG: AtpZ/AtpI family protein [Gilvibacter sp.]
MTAPNAPKNQKQNSRINQYAKYAGIPFQMIVIVGLGTYGGVKLDEYTQNQDSLYTIICSFAAVCIALFVVIRQVTQGSKNKN